MVKAKPRFMLLAIVLLALVAAMCFAYPMYVIRPFRHQGATELAAALAVIRIRPWLSVISAVLCLLVTVLAWRGLRGKFARGVAVAAVLMAASACYLSRINVYELMFHPAGQPQFEAADHAKVDPDDMVIAVRANGAARAYPIREMAYHHVVNDAFAGEPIVATY
jgi:hypothetical protein